MHCNEVTLIRPCCGEPSFTILVGYFLETKRCRRLLRGIDIFVGGV